MADTNRQKQNMARNNVFQEEWIPLPFIRGECSLSGIEYDATNLLVELDSFQEGRTIKIVFADVFSYRVTLEQFRWAEFSHAPKVSATLVKVINSRYIEWIEDAGMKQIYDSDLDISHYMLRATEHIIDVALLSDSTIAIDGKTCVQGKKIIVRL